MKMSTNRNTNMKRMKTERENLGPNQISIIDVEEIEENNQKSTFGSHTQIELVTSREDSIHISQKLTTSKIILNEEKIPFFHGLLGIALIAGITFLTLIVTWWPQNNVVLFPEYWFEPIPLFFFILANAAGYVHCQARFLLNNQETSAIKSIAIYYSITLFGNVASFVSIYYLWTHFYGYPHPMPLTGHAWYLLHSILLHSVAIWMMFPSNLKRRGSTFRKKIFLFVILGLLRNLAGFGYASIGGLPLVTNKKWQWTLGILFPLLKKMNIWWNQKFTNWAFDGDEETVAIENVIYVGVQHSQILTVFLSSSNFEQLTTLILIFADSLMNFLSFRMIIRFHQQGTPAANELRDRSLKILAVKEFLEFLIPCAFLLSFVGSYVGPNYEIIGGLGSDMWHHEKTTSLIEKLQNIVLLMALESFRGIGFGVVLWYLYGMNLYSGYRCIIRKFGWFILFLASYLSQMVSGHYQG